MSFVVNTGSDDALNSIVLGSVSEFSGSLALDLSAIYGTTFELTISTSTELSDLALDIIFADDSIEGLSFTTGEYDVSSYEALDSLSISYEDSVYTIKGSVAGTAVPEPSTYAMIFGVVALGFAYYRRRKQ